MNVRYEIYTPLPENDIYSEDTYEDALDRIKAIYDRGSSVEVVTKTVELGVIHKGEGYDLVDM